ncbi:MAG: NAD(+) synthase [Bacteroidales bacterium]|nr:NAD(+) synthase [Bacteroidales bacterium]
MDSFGFIRVAAASPRVKVADVDFNAGEICSFIEKAEDSGVSLLVFPELGITGYTCGDLFGQNLLLEAAESGVGAICSLTRGKKVTVVLGAPVRFVNRLYNCAIVIRNGSIHGIVPKSYIPNYNEFYEARWFASGADMDAMVTYCGKKVRISPFQLFRIGEATFAVEICEDLWTPVPPSSFHTVAGADIIVNLSASNELIAKHAYRRQLVSNQSGRCVCAYIYSSSGFGESTQDLVFAGSSMICENGAVLAESERFVMEGTIIEADVDVEKLKSLRQKANTFTIHADLPEYHEVALGAAATTDFSQALLRHVETTPFVPGGKLDDQRANEILSIQVTGLMTRLSHVRCNTAVIGISGGLDSTLALLVTALAFDRLGWDRRRITGVTMPGFGTTGRTYRNAIDLMEALDITVREVPIGPAVSQHFDDIGQDPEVHDVTYENAQARERTQILMDIANKENGIVVGTGDLSELALGWATYNGDHMSMYGVNASIPKTLVKHLVRWAAINHFGSDGSPRSAKDILLDVADTPISPELTPADENGEIAQKTEDLVGPYELHDFFLYNIFRFGFTPQKVRFLALKAFDNYSEALIDKWITVFCRRFFTQQFKRSCMPDGPKVGSVSLSPRGDWRMPSDASFNLWIDNKNNNN